LKQSTVLRIWRLVTWIICVKGTLALACFSLGHIAAFPCPTLFSPPRATTPFTHHGR
jgi:hypothetical protein